MRNIISLLSCGALLLAPSPLVQAQTAERPQSAPSMVNVGAAVSPVLRRTLMLRSADTSTGSRVTLTADSPLSDYGAVRRGNEFSVTIPQSRAATLKGGLRGRGFTDVSFETREGDVVLTFLLEEGTSASVNQVFNRLDLTFTVVGAQPDAAAESPAERAAPAAARPAAAVPASLTFSSAPSPNTALAAPAPGPVPRQTPRAVNKIKEADVNFEVPESPAFTVLGLTPQTVTRPLTAKQLATSLLSGVDMNGNFQTGLAIDTAPVLAVIGPNTDIKKYQRNYATRLAFRFTTSFANTKGATDDDKSVKLALGFALPLWDRGDPRNVNGVFIKCAEDALSLKDMPQTGPPTTDQEEKAEEYIKPRLQFCRDKARKANWNASGLMIAGAPSWVSTSGKTSDFKWNGGGMWTSLAYGFEDFGDESWFRKHSQFVVHARFRTNEQVPDPDAEGTFFSRDSQFVGFRFRGGSENTVGNAEYVYLRSRRDASDYDSAYRLTFGFDRRVAENIWFSVSGGGENGRRDNNNQTFILTSFKWGLTQKKVE